MENNNKKELQNVKEYKYETDSFLFLIYQPYDKLLNSNITGLGTIFSTLIEIITSAGMGSHRSMDYAFMDDKLDIIVTTNLMFKFKKIPTAEDKIEAIRFIADFYGRVTNNLPPKNIEL